jgi:hypothetical protein
MPRGQISKVTIRYQGAGDDRRSDNPIEDGVTEHIARIRGNDRVPFLGEQLVRSVPRCGNPAFQAFGDEFAGCGVHGLQPVNGLNHGWVINQLQQVSWR